MEIVKLVLEYLRVLTWPIIVLLIVILFHDPLRDFIGRLEKANLPGGVSFEAAGTTGGEKSVDRKAPDVSFSWISHNLSMHDCQVIAEEALKETLYEDIGVRSGVSVTVYGYEEGYVGAIWCTEQSGLALIVVSGPDSADAENRRYELESAFIKRLPPK